MLSVEPGNKRSMRDRLLALRPKETHGVDDGGRSGLGRVAAIDVARGVALFGMAVYHFSWDLAYFSLAPPDFPSTPAMRLFSHVVAASFLALAGVSLVLAHHDGFRRRAFLRRLALICGAAVLVTGATYLLSPANAIYFGILHCIALASLIAAPMLQAPLLAAFGASVFVFAAPFVLANPAFDQPPIAWLGLGADLPATLDWRPLAPWSGFVFLGLALTRLGWRRLTASRLWSWRPKSSLAGAVDWTGRHTLAIYLIHQPILFAILYAATGLGVGEAKRVEERFREACIHACEAGAGAAEHCNRGCQCVIDGLKAANLTVAFTREDFDPGEREKFSSVIRQCASQPQEK